MENDLRKDKKLFITKKSDIQGNGNFVIKFLPKNTNLGIGLIKINNSKNPDKDYIRYDICTYTNHSENPNIFYKKMVISIIFIL